MLSTLLENLGLSCPHSEGNAETGREEGRGLTGGSPAQDATASAAACEGGEHRLEGGQTRGWPDPPPCPFFTRPPGAR